ncbi:hypothetical protein [Vulcanisaeta distributa]|uniref:DNA-directed RNA polymerase subunit Rpo12 n=1 Tax=Vulcanisaeta distributa (strain DSM 14429 / JCM 11212 / NBRC 100878 / IC-017) TaxID=572478 RepID=E1QT64_VULDI|nr:hypothetical protein [Vulcanisaeta distributa]ADN49656.1 conserved hypothetical protein [Vulcanisaeta distributa DSM 14429]
MRIRLNLECPRCGGALFMEEDDKNVSVYCIRCGLRVSWKLRDAARRAVKNIDGSLIFDWSSVIDELYLELTINH